MTLLDLRKNTIKPSHLSGIVCALILFALNRSACAALIVSDDTSLSGRDVSYAQSLAASPQWSSDVALTLDVPGGIDQTQLDKEFNFFQNGTSSGNPHTDSHESLWLLFLVASVFGILSEIFHRRSCNQ